jgi:hypothetical protein
MKTLISTLLFTLSKVKRAAAISHNENHFAFTAWSECDSFLYMGTHHGIFRKNKLNGHLEFLNQTNSNLPSNQVTSITCTKEGITLIGTQKGVVQCDNKTNFLLHRLYLNLPDHHITALTVDSNDDIWMGTANGGLLKSSGEKKNTLNLHAVHTRNKNIFSLSVDPQGSVWVVFQNGVIEYFQKGNTPATRTIPQVEEEHSNTTDAFLLRTSCQGTFLTDGHSFSHISTDPAFEPTSCTYYNPAYHRMVLCNKDGVLVFQISDPLSGYRKWSYADFVQSIAVRGSDKEITKIIKQIKELEQGPRSMEHGAWSNKQ